MGRWNRPTRRPRRGLSAGWPYGPLQQRQGGAGGAGAGGGEAGFSVRRRHRESIEILPYG